jgi:serine/threonine protein kinase
MRSSQPDEAALRCFIREVSVLSKMEHETILKFMGYIPFRVGSDIHPSIITELMPNHSLKEPIESPAKAPATWDDTQKMIILYGVAVGMRFLHMLKVMHRDLKPENVLLNEYWEPKIGDFGFLKLDDSMGQQTLEVGSQAYMAPELLEGADDYSFPVDVYAYAVLANSVLSGQSPFFEARPADAFKLTGQVIRGGRRPIIGDGVNEAWKDLIRRCWDGAPSDRPTFSEIVDELSQARFLQRVDVVRFLRYQQKIGIEPKLLAETENLVGIRATGQAEKVEYFRRSTEHGSIDGMLNYALVIGDVGLIEEAKNIGSGAAPFRPGLSG